MMRHGRPIAILGFLSLALVACGNKKKDREDGPPRWDAFPVQIYTDPALVPNAEAAEDFQKAMQFWEQKVGKQLFDYRGSWAGQAYDGGDAVAQNSIYFHSPWTYSSNIAAQTIVLSQKSEIRGAVIMVNPNTAFCGGDCHGMSSYTSQRKVFAHELGHFIGLGHSSDTANIMFPDALPGGSIDALAIDAAELRPLVD